MTANWLHRYNHHRPHETLGSVPRVEYRVKKSPIATSSGSGIRGGLMWLNLTSPQRGTQPPAQQSVLRADHTAPQYL
jgi:hypothetical protein